MASLGPVPLGFCFSRACEQVVPCFGLVLRNVFGKRCSIFL